MVDPTKFTEAARRALNVAFEDAESRGSIQVTPTHLMLALMKSPDGLAKRVVVLAGGHPNILTSKLEAAANKMPQQKPAQPPTPNNALRETLHEAIASKSTADVYATADQLLVACASDKTIEHALRESGTTKAAVEEAVRRVRPQGPVTSNSAESTYEALSKYAVNLVEQSRAGKLDPVIGRDAEVRRLVQVLARRTKNNPVLVGEPGVGKTAIVEGFAQRVLAGDVPDTLQDVTVMALDVGALVAGAKFKGEFEERLKAVIKEVTDAQGKIVLFIDEIHLVLGAGAGADSPMNAANLLKPALARGELRCIGATTDDEYRKYVEKDPAFERRFARVQVGEPSVLDTVSILRGLKARYEAHHGVTISDAALVAAAQMSARYIQGRFLPDKAIDLLDEAAANTRVQLDSQPEAIDKAQRSLLRLEVEKTALKSEKGAQAKARLADVEVNISKTNELLSTLRAQYQQERGIGDALRDMRRRLEKANMDAEAAERNHDLTKAADLRYGLIPELMEQVGALEKKAEAEEAREAAAEEAGVAPKRMLSERVGTEQIAEVVARWTGIPVKRLTESEKEKVLCLAERLGRDVVGQDEAVNAVADAVLRARAGLAQKNRPTASFLMLGPTGVGKTALAKALARDLFDDHDTNRGGITSVDCSEYSERHAIARLIGAPPGYVGHDEGGQLTEAVRTRPFSVVLFDEVEKAGQELFDILLQVLDEGRLTDGKGRTVDFSNTVVILTSNLGAGALLAAAGRGDDVWEEAKTQAAAALRAHFRPEFLNRLDEVLLFKPLSLEALRRIARMAVDEMIAGPLQERSVKLQVTQRVLDHCLREAYDPAYGARPLRRHISKWLGTQVGKTLLQTGRDSGGTIFVDTDSNGRLNVSMVVESNGVVSPSSAKRSRMETLLSGQDSDNSYPTTPPVTEPESPMMSD